MRSYPRKRKDEGNWFDLIYVRRIYDSTMTSSANETKKVYMDMIRVL